MLPVLEKNLVKYVSLGIKWLNLGIFAIYVDIFSIVSNTLNCKYLLWICKFTFRKCVNSNDRNVDRS